MNTRKQTVTCQPASPPVLFCSPTLADKQFTQFTCVGNID